MQMQWIKTLTILGLVILILVGIKAYQIKQSIDSVESLPEHSETVESAWLVSSEYSPSIKVVGKIVSPEQLNVISELEGRIVKVGFTSGSSVKKNQLLIQQDSSEEDALLKATKSRLQLAKTLLIRNQRLLRTRAVSQEDVDRALVNLDNTEAEIAQLNSIIRKKNIQAPFAGATGVQHFHNGQILSANQFITELTGKTQERWIDFYLPQNIPILSINSSIDFFLATTKKPFTAKIMASSKSLDESNKSRHYRAAFNVVQSSSLSSLAIGSSVEVAIIRKNTNNIKEVWQVPSTSILYSLQGSYVFTLISDNKYQKNDSSYMKIENHPKTLREFRAREKFVEVLDKKEKMTKIKFIDDTPKSMLIAADGAFKLYPEVLTKTTPPINDRK